MHSEVFFVQNFENGTENCHEEQSGDELPWPVMEFSLPPTGKLFQSCFLPHPRCAATLGTKYSMFGQKQYVSKCASDKTLHYNSFSDRVTNFIVQTPDSLNETFRNSEGNIRNSRMRRSPDRKTTGKPLGTVSLQL